MTFHEWLLSNHYSATTAKNTIPDLARGTVCLKLGKPLDSNARVALRRYVAYADAAGFQDDTTKRALRAGIGAVVKLPSERAPERKHEARSFDEGDWDNLLSVVDSSADPRDITLAIMGSTSLRVGDVLRIVRSQVNKAVESGVLYSTRKGGGTKPMPLGIMEPWQRLLDGMTATGAWNVAEFVCPSSTSPDAGQCAYQRVNRRLKAIGRRFDMEGRCHLHRMRRTLAVRALETTENTVAVQHMLGHASAKTTMKYLDEVDVNRQRKLQRRLAGLEE
jgi:integrase